MTDPRPQHDAAVSGMFGRIAGFYDLLNHTLSLGIDYYWRHVLAKNVRVGSTNRVLDLAAAGASDAGEPDSVDIGGEYGTEIGIVMILAFLVNILFARCICDDIFGR